MVARLRIRPEVVVGPALILALFATIDLFRQAGSQPGIDYYQFWAAARAVREGLTADVYAQAEGPRLGRLFHERARSEGGAWRQREASEFRRELDLLATPFMYTVFGTLSSGDYERDYLAFRVASWIAGVAAIVGLCRLLAYPPGVALVLLALCYGPFVPLTADASVGNLGAIQLACIVAYLGLLRGLRSPRGDILAGALLGLAAMFKPNLAVAAGIVLLALLFEGRTAALVYRLAGMVGAGLAALLASSAFVGTPACWLGWARAVDRVVPNMGTAGGNFSLVMMLRERTPPPVWALVPVVLGLAALWALWRAGAGARAARGAGRAAPDADADPDTFVRDGLAVSAGCALGLLSASLAWIHYYVLLVPLALCLWRPSSGGPRDADPGARWAATAGMALMCNLPWPVVPGLTTMVQGTLQYALAALILLVAGLRQHARLGRTTA